MKNFKNSIALALLIGGLGLAGCSDAQKESVSEAEAAAKEAMEAAGDSASDVKSSAGDLWTKLTR